MRDASVDRPAGGELNAAIADAVVQLHSRYAGRGPTRARAFMRDDVVVLIMRDALTAGERSLVARGQRGAALELRRRFQDVMRTELIEAVERLTGHCVDALLSDTEVEPDVVSYLFLLDRRTGCG